MGPLTALTTPAAEPNVVSLERLADRNRPLGPQDSLSALSAVERFGRRTFIGMIDAAPPERAQRLREILRLADRTRHVMRELAPVTREGA